MAIITRIFSPLQAQTRTINRHWWFIAGLAVIVILAAGLRLAHTDWGLPYVEYNDEVHLYFHGQARRGLYDSTYTGIYPPVFVWLNMAVQQIMESQGRPGLVPTVHTLRILAALANTSTMIFIGLAAYLLAGGVAGLLAAGAWAISTYAVEHSLYAIPEPFVYPLVGLCLLLAAVALSRPERWRWALASLAVAGLVFLFEYRLFVLAMPGGLIVLWRLLRRWQLTPRRWLILALLALNLGVMLVTAVFFALPRYQPWLVRVLLLDMWNLQSLGNHFLEALRGIGAPTLVAVILVLGLAAWIIARRRGERRVDGKQILLYAGMFCLICWVMSAVRWTGDLVRTKNTLVAAVAGCVLLGAAVEQIIRRLSVPLGRAIVALMVAALLFIPQWEATTAQLEGAFTGVSWQVIIRQWADVNVTPGTVIVYKPHEKTFNPFWGGIPHRYWFDWWPTTNLMEHSLEEWREQGMAYALLPIPQYQAMASSEDGQAYLAEMLPLRDFVHPPTRREAEAIFFRLWRMDVETQYHFGENITLVGYDRSAQTLQAGEKLTLRFYWQASATPTDNYSLFIHLVPLDSFTALTQADGAPAVPERPTLTWDVPGETLISPTFELSLPEDLAASQYRMLVGLYNFQTGQRLPVTDEEGQALGDALELMTVKISP